MKALLIGLLGAVIGAVLCAVIPLVVSVVASLRVHSDSGAGAGAAGFNLTTVVPTPALLLFAAAIGFVAAVVWYLR